MSRDYLACIVIGFFVFNIFACSFGAALGLNQFAYLIPGTC